MSYHTYTFRKGGRLYRIRKAPMETDDVAAKRGWKIASALAVTQQSQAYALSVPAIVSGSFMTGN